MCNMKCSINTFHISNTNLPAHTDPNQFFLSVFCNCDQYSILENTDRAAHRIGAAQTTSVATAGNKTQHQWTSVYWTPQVLTHGSYVLRVWTSGMLHDTVCRHAPFQWNLHPSCMNKIEGSILFQDNDSYPPNYMPPPPQTSVWRLCSTVLWNPGILPLNHMVSHPRRQQYSLKIVGCQQWLAA